MIQCDRTGWIESAEYWADQALFWIKEAGQCSQHTRLKPALEHAVECAIFCFQQAGRRIDWFVDETPRDLANEVRLELTLDLVAE